MRVRTMSKVLLGEIAIERKETCKGNKNGFPIVGLEHLTPEQVTLSDWDEDRSNTFTKLFYEGDILFGRRRAYLKKAAVAPFNGICSGDITVIKAIPERILPELLPFVIQNDSFFQYAVGKSAGSLSPRVKWEYLRNYEFELPNLDKQRELAKVLWAMEETKIPYMNLLKRIDELVKGHFVQMFGDPVTNSYDCQVVTFKNYIKNIRYGTSQPPKFSDDGPYKFIRATNIKDKHITENDMLFISLEEAEKIEKCKLNGNELLMVRSGANTGDTCIITDPYRGHYAGYDIIITFDLSRANPVFFNELLNTNYMDQIVKPLTARAAQPHINAQQVQSLPMIVVPIEAQNIFAQFVEEAEKFKFELQHTLVDLIELNKKIIADAFID